MAKKITPLFKVIDSAFTGEPAWASKETSIFKSKNDIKQLKEMSARLLSSYRTNFLIGEKNIKADHYGVQFVLIMHRFKHG